MTEAFVDTTIIADATLKLDPLRAQSRSALLRYTITNLPVYALKEYRLGIFRAYSWLHDKFLQTQSLSLTQNAIEVLSRSYQKNFPSSVRSALTLALTGMTRGVDIGELQKKYGNRANLDYVNADLCRLQLKKIMYKAWKERKSLCSNLTHPLTCFSDSDPSFRDGVLFAFGNKGCDVGRECEVKKLLFQNKSDLQKVLAAVKAQPKKKENERRIEAIGEVLRNSKRPFKDNDCRNLGDAVFAILAPAGSEILTTNVSDHEPLASALGKTVSAP